MALIHGTAPKCYSGKDKEAYEVAASRAYSHVAHAYAYGGDTDSVGGPPTGLRHHWNVWQIGWAAGKADAIADHES